MPYISLDNNIQHNLDSSKALILTHSNTISVMENNLQAKTRIGMKFSILTSVTGKQEENFS